MAIVFTADRLFTGDRVVSPGHVVVEGDRIRAIATRRAPAGPDVLDLGDATILPGLVDAHSHVSVVPGLAIRWRSFARRLTFSSQRREPTLRAISRRV